MYYAVVPYKSEDFSINDKILIMDTSDYTCEYIDKKDKDLVQLRGLTTRNGELRYDRLAQGLLFFFGDIVIRETASGYISVNDNPCKFMAKGASIAYAFKYRTCLVVRTYHLIAGFDRRGVVESITSWHSMMISPWGEVVAHWHEKDCTGTIPVQVDTLLSI